MLYEIDAGDLIDSARRWAGLGDAVAEQVSQVVDDPRAAAGLRSADLEVIPRSTPTPSSWPRSGSAA